jgi:predicted Rossmann fold flavoprotein
MKIAIIGGGAAGFFAAIHAQENFPEAEVYIFEKSQKVLAKVKVSGGGRCNVTNAAANINTLSEAYPRGKNFLKKAFHHFSNHDAMRWFEERGVALVTQEDACVFPHSQDSQSIIDVFMAECKRLGIRIKLGSGITGLKPIEDHIALAFSTGDQLNFDKVIVATGGSPKREGLVWLAQLGHKIEMPVPSLFTFNMPDESIRSLMGIVVENALVSIQGTKLKADGPLLITHWGMSGPAILKLSAFGARILSEMNYNFNVQVNWLNEKNNEKVLDELLRLAAENPQKRILNARPQVIPSRLWTYLLERAAISSDRTWVEVGRKGLNRLVGILTNDHYVVKGKTTFKEEFVTCGGVSLESINAKTMASKHCPNLYFAGEVMDIDGITGGFNFQAAWTTAFIAAKLA